MAEFVPPSTRFVSLPDPFPMKRGGALRGARVAYETWGRPSPAGDNAVLLLGGLSPNAHAASHAADAAPGWWEAMLGPGKPIDTDAWHVICVNALGSCHGSTGPASADPETGEAYRLGFPDLSVEDVADAAAHAVRALGVTRLACVIGNSMGGMCALSLIARHPGLARAHLNISGAVHALPFAIAIRSLQRGAIRMDPHWDGGRYDDARYPEAGMTVARKLGVITYRSAAEWEERFGRAPLARPGAPAAEPFGPEYEVEGYLDGQARRFVRGYDPNCYLYLSRSIDRFDLGDAFGTRADEALRRLPLERALAIGVTSDLLFPPRQQRQIARGLRAGGVAARGLELASPQGHDAFLVDVGRFGPAVRGFMSELAEGRPRASRPSPARRGAARPRRGGAGWADRPAGAAPSPPSIQ